MIGSGTAQTAESSAEAPAVAMAADAAAMTDPADTAAMAAAVAVNQRADAILHNVSCGTVQTVGQVMMCHEVSS